MVVRVRVRPVGPHRVVDGDRRALVGAEHLLEEAEISISWVELELELVLVLDWLIVRLVVRRSSLGAKRAVTLRKLLEGELPPGGRGGRTGGFGSGWLEHPRQWLGALVAGPLPWECRTAQSRQARPGEAQEPSSGAARGLITR